MKKLLDKEEFTKREKIIYRKLQPKFKKDKGKIVSIEVESGDYFIRDDKLEAAKKARSKFPDKIFVFLAFLFSNSITLKVDFKFLALIIFSSRNREHFKVIKICFLETQLFMLNYS